jgi:uncharacterized Zn finger protein (UPF0148 family)
MARRIAMAAIIGLNALDPDQDGDIDLLMPDGSVGSSSSSQEAVTPDDDNGMSPPVCGECGNGVPDGALYCPTCGNSLVNAESEVPAEPIETKDEEALVPEVTPTAPAESAAESVAPVAPAAAEAAAPMVALTQEQFQALLAAVKPVEAAPVEAAVVEPPKTYTAEEMAAALEAQRVTTETDAVEMIRAAGIIPRTGLVPATGLGVGGAQVAEMKIPSLKELSEMSDEDYLRNTEEALKVHPKWGALIRRADAKASY